MDRDLHEEFFPQTAKLLEVVDELQDISNECCHPSLHDRLLVLQVVF